MYSTRVTTLLKQCLNIVYTLVNKRALVFRVDTPGDFIKRVGREAKKFSRLIILDTPVYVIREIA